MSRRGLLAGAGAWTAVSALARRGQAQVVSSPVSVRGTARSCLFINLLGAPSHVDTFDFKPGPWTPADARPQQLEGGLVLNLRLFPALSRFASDLCVLRSVKSWEAAHERGQYYLQTGHANNPAFLADTPHLGAVVALEKGGKGNLPPFLSLNGGTGPGAMFLGGAYEPMAPALAARGFGLLEHDYYVRSVAEERFNQKYQLLEDLDREGRSTGFGHKAISDYGAYSLAARKLMYDPEVAAVFQYTTAEDERYGSTPFGRACLVARNAVRARNGAVFLNLNHDGWDTHQDMFTGARLMYGLCGVLDTGLSALLADLKASGDLAQTLIVMLGEFGRTPGPLNGRGGRDHHRNAQFAVFAGGGIRGGRIIGATDRTGNAISDPGWSRGRPVYMEDIAATVYSALGINWTTAIQSTPSGRRFAYVDSTNVPDPSPVEEAFL